MHIQKCFEGIDKVYFLHDLSIDRIISPEGEEVMLTNAIDPVGKWKIDIQGCLFTHMCTFICVSYCQKGRK
jgi:hypothetical protein